MLTRRSGRPPTGLLALMLGVAIVPLVTLLWLGWQLELKERELEAGQARQQVDQAATLVAAALQRAVAQAGQRVATGSEDWAPGAVVVTFHRDHVSIVPEHAIAYYPVVAAVREAPASVFDDVDEFEFRNVDRARAIETARALTQSRDGAIRATAAFRVARLLNADGRRREALAAYAALTNINDVAVGGAPMALAARYARCALLADLNEPATLRSEAGRLASDLRAGRWMLTEPGYRLYVVDADRWSGSAPVAVTSGEILAEAVGALWSRRDTWPRNAGAAVPPELLTVQGQSLTVLPQLGPGVTRALIATPAFVEAEWLSAAAPLARDQQVSFTLGVDGDQGETAVRRTAAQAELPWGLTVRSLVAPPGAFTFDARRQLLASGLAVLVILSLFASYVVWRAVNRELAVARLQSDFVAAVSHELRTPLTSLRQFTDMLREGAAKDDGQRAVCYEAQSRSTDRLTRLVESLLDFGRMEAGARSYHFEPVSCAEIVQSVVEECRQDIQAAGYRIEFNNAGTAEVDADREALGRALRNLLENAVKYSPDHHTVEVGVTRREATVSISVRDHGIGVPAAEREAIFGRFQRGAEARIRGIKGTGLGLAMVDHIVRAHHGRISVESAPGEGSLFTIELPVKA